MLDCRCEVKWFVWPTGVGTEPSCADNNKGSYYYNRCPSGQTANTYTIGTTDQPLGTGIEYAIQVKLPATDLLSLLLPLTLCDTLSLRPLSLAKQPINM